MALRELPLFPLGSVLFPGMILPLHIFEERYKTMMQRCLTNNEPFGVVLIRDGHEVGAGQVTLFDIGTMAYITQIDRLDDGRMNIASLGLHRFKIHEVYESKEPYLIGLVEEFPFSEINEAEALHAASGVGPLLLRYLDVLGKVSDADVSLDKVPEDATTLAFLAAIVVRAPMPEKQNLLSIASLPALLQEEKKLLERELQVLTLMLKSAPRWRDQLLPFTPN